MVFRLQKKSNGLGMGGEVTVLFLRPERTRSPDSPTCLFGKELCKKGWILDRDSLAGNPQNKITSVPRIWLFAAKTVREWVEQWRPYPSQALEI